MTGQSKACISPWAVAEPTTPMHKTRATISSISALLCLLACGGPLAAQTINFENFDYGPYDYTNPLHYRERLPVVEKYHFNSDVENLRASMPGGTIGSHILYVIRSFPNHHRALSAFGRLWDRSGSLVKPPAGVGRHQTPDFVYQRALAFAPTDGTVRLLYGIYLDDAGRQPEALQMIDQAAELAPDTADINYNLGLMYLRLGEHDKADFHASKAYDQGHPLPGLRKKMVAAGIWQS